MNINTISNINGILTGEKINRLNTDPNGKFADFLVSKLKDVNAMQIKAESLDTLFAAGLEDDIAKVTTAAAKADIAITMTVEITNKIIAAYNEIMRIQL